MSEEKPKEENKTGNAFFSAYNDSPNLFSEAVKQTGLASKLALNIKLPKFDFFEKMPEIRKGFQEISSALQTAMEPMRAFKKSIWEEQSKIAEILEKTRHYQFEIKQSILDLWNKFEEELKTKNRYFPKSVFLTIFEKCAKEANHTLNKGSVLYRARKIGNKEFSESVRKITNVAVVGFNEYDYQKKLTKNGDVWEYIEEISQMEWEESYINRLSLQEVDFWGFDKKHSDAPLENTMQGRVNPVGISYLYTASDINTSIAEVQPTIEQFVSVAKVKTLRKLKIFDFDFHNIYKDSELLYIPLSKFPERVGESFWYVEAFFKTVSELFSKPIVGNTDSYYATQYVSEFIKHLGFDGIKYESSLNKGGSNIVLFDTSKDDSGNPRNYTILSSSLHKVENVKVTAKRILPRKSSKKP